MSLCKETLLAYRLNMEALSKSCYLYLTKLHFRQTFEALNGLMLYRKIELW